MSSHTSPMTDPEFLFFPLKLWVPLFFPRQTSSRFGVFIFAGAASGSLDLELGVEAFTFWILSLSEDYLIPLYSLFRCVFIWYNPVVYCLDYLILWCISDVFIVSPCIMKNLLMRDVQFIVLMFYFPKTIWLSGTWASAMNTVDVLLSIHKGRGVGSFHLVSELKVETLALGNITH